ncbi:MAG TPA: hypothetical protein VF221_00070 [Chloroflexota bacterium]
MRTVLGIAATCAALVSATQASASSAHRTIQGLHPAHRAGLTRVTFRLHVAGSPDPGTTIWVSHGPLVGRFDVIELKPAGNNVYMASAVFPANATTTWAFLAAHGAVRTRAGLMPGTSIVVIDTFQNVTASAISRRTVLWGAAVG